MRELRTEEEIVASWEGDIDEPVVSICCTTYNHEFYIEDALQGFLTQKTDFPYEILVHDDASTDRTSEIIREYNEKYPRLIRSFLQTENQYSQGVRFLDANNLFINARGKYVALCDGDDYWTSPAKLSKQINILKNTGLCFSFHQVEQIDETINKDAYSAFCIPSADTVRLEDLALNHYIPTSSLVFDLACLPVDFPLYSKRRFNGDMFYHFLLGTVSNGFYLNESMGVYRHHDSGLTKGDAFRDGAFLKDINLYTELNEITNGKYSGLINKRLSLILYKRSRRYLKKGKLKKGLVNMVKAFIKYPFFIKLLINRKVFGRY